MADEDKGKTYGYMECPRIGDFKQIFNELTKLRRKVYEGNGHESLETRMSLVETNLEGIAESLKTLVASETTAIRYIEREQAKESTREHDKASRAGEVKEDLAQSNIKKDRSQTLRLSIAAIFATLVVSAVGWGVTIHEDRRDAIMQAQWQQSLRVSVQELSKKQQ